jgi:hypothetical protein
MVEYLKDLVGLNKPPKKKEEELDDRTKLQVFLTLLMTLQ